MHSIFEIVSEDPDSAGPDLISLDDLKFALGITGTAEDATLQAMITLKSQLIAEYCDRRFGRAEALETFTFDPWEILPVRQPLALRLYPVATVTEVSSSADYDLDPPTGRLWLPNGGAPGPTTISYAGGYDLPEEAPARLRVAVIEAVNESRQSGSRDPNIREVSHGDTRIAYFTSPLATGSSGYLSAPVIDLIRPYRRLSAA
jgi:Phage gp6-like head-tail connector protein